MTYRIMLACAAGMSTSLLVEKMQAEASARGLDATIWAGPTSEADEALAGGDLSVLLLGPQVTYLAEDYRAKGRAAGVPVDVVPMMDYGMMNGAAVLDLALRLADEGR